MKPIQCPRCSMLYPVVGPEWAGRAFPCACGQLVTVPPLPVHSQRPVVESSPLAFDYDDPDEDTSTPRASVALRRSRVAPDGDANAKLTIGLIAIVLAIAAFGFAGLADTAPLIQANNYVIPGILSAVAAVGVAIFGMCRVSGFSTLLTIGLSLGGIALLVCGVEAAAINERWAEIARQMRRL